MRRERALKIVLVLVGLLFVATVYPLVMMLRQEPALAMMLSVYFTLGIFLLIAVRNPSANRSLIGFTAWSSFAHALVMSALALLQASERTRRLSGWLGYACRHRCSPDCAGSDEAVSRGDIGGRD